MLPEIPIFLPMVRVKKMPRSSEHSSEKFGGPGRPGWPDISCRRDVVWDMVVNLRRIISCQARCDGARKNRRIA